MMINGNHYINITIEMPEKIDVDLKKMMEDWAEKHSYNPRHKREKKKA